MLTTTNNGEVDFGQYRPLISSQLSGQLTDVASNFKGLRIVHLNSTAKGGGVAEILQSMTPLMNSLGITTEWIVINPPAEFFQVTKRIHNLLQGAPGTLSAEELKTYFGSIETVADEIRSAGLKADVWFMHDPQLLPLAGMLRSDHTGEWNWVCHIDLTSPNSSVLETLLPLTHDYDRLVFSLDAYVPRELAGSPRIRIAPPAIDPVSVKNTAMDETEAFKIVSDMGIDSSRPLITQVSRFDLWKDPCGVIDAYRLARKDVPGLQLAMLGLSEAIDDPESLDVFNSVAGHAKNDPDIHLYFSCDGLPTSIDRVVNAFQVSSKVLLQKSTREGFGLTVTEAMWKGKPMIGGNVGGIRIQIEDGVSGYLVNNPEECAWRIVKLIGHPDKMLKMGEAARESVRQRFLLPRLALDYLNVAHAGMEAASD
ncbi:MAG: glycosyl transferase family 1 [Planctomyces sp.]|nr:glycosyl transferase family 1 [Planctomyces sp.]